jgi:hypothetical protein
MPIKPMSEREIIEYLKSVIKNNLARNSQKIKTVSMINARQISKIPIIRQRNSDSVGFFKPISKKSVKPII